MIVTTMPFAFASEMEIEPFVPVTVTVSESINPVFKFVPKVTASYYLTSYAGDASDPYASIEFGNETLIIDDENDSRNFREKLEFTEGTEYYITIFTYEEEEATFDVVLECAHKYVDATCKNCGRVCNHEIEGMKFNSCECRKVSKCPEIKLGDEIDYTFDCFNPLWYRFTPDEDVTAVLYSDVFNDENHYDVSAEIYNADGDRLVYNDDRFDSYDFVLFYTFEAGETYFFQINSYYEDLDIDLFFVLAQHTAADGEVHDVVIVPENDNAICGESIYSESVYCAECDCYFVGHNEIGYVDHIDDNGDYYCDYNCGYEYEKPYEPAPEVPDEPETPNEPDVVCEDCGRPAHENEGVPMYICVLITLIKLVVSFFNAIR